MHKLNISGRRALSAEEAGLNTVCAPWYEISFEQGAAQSDGTVSGSVTVHCILAGNGGEAAPARVEMPFKTVICEGGSGKLSRTLGAELSGLRLFCEGGALNAEGELSVSATVTEKTTDETVCSVKAQEAEKRSGSGMTVIYPQRGDTLWSVAKQRRVSPETLCKMNGMDEDRSADPNAADSLDGIRCLMIVK